MLSKLDKTKYLNKMLDAFPIDRLQVTRLKHRVDLAQKIVKASRQVQRQGFEEKWLAEAADDLGVDADEIEQVINSKGYLFAYYVSDCKEIWEAAGGKSV
jgi:hypothetical protein